MYNLELEKIIEYVSKEKPQKILIQIPEGLTGRALEEIVDKIAQYDTEIVISANPTFGFCDLDLNEAKQFKYDLVIHFGHNDYFFKRLLAQKEEKTKVITIPATITINIEKVSSILLEQLNRYNWKTIGLVTTVQYLNSVPEIKSYLTKNNITTLIKNTGQILGCNVSNANFPNSTIDGIVAIVSGNFHSLGLNYQFSEPVLVIDPLTDEVQLFTKEDHNRWLNKRFWLIEKAKKAKKWGILVSTKPGQYNPHLVKEIKKILAEKNLQGYIFSANTLLPEYFINYTWIDSWVNTACPRIAFEDYERYRQPVLSFQEFRYIMGKLTWDELLEKGSLT